MELDGPLPIGEVADLLGVATSALRYYERRRLVVADGRASGQRRYGPATVRRLVFVQMLQDAGLSLDDIQGILGADDNAAWKEIARVRLEQLDADIVRLRYSRELLAAALLCRFDHPLDECQIMNREIDRRLAVGGTIAERNDDAERR
jgi:MerR family transcriptional regulator, copper efflux regulator